ncbi:MAG: helical backbone metal receptor [Candidatus Omnitrophota bacterium]|nr:ABC transporter substrate-binding protein [Candidatus Omnitrophota bacterium]
MGSIRKYILSVLTVFAVLMSCTWGYSEDHPQRIISLSPVVTEEIYLLGAEDRLIGITTYCIRPEAAGSKDKVGTVMKADIERIVMLKPDIVLATSLTDIRQMRQLEGLGIRVETFPDATDLETICAGFIRLADILGKNQEAENIVRRVRERVEELKRRTANLPKKKVFVQIGAKPLFAATKKSFVNDFITFAGGINLTEDLVSGLYSREKVIESDPDIIVITGMGIEGEEEKKVWMKYGTIKAVRNNAIYTVEPYGLCSPTPVSFVESLDNMIRMLHG